MTDKEKRLLGWFGVTVLLAGAGLGLSLWNDGNLALDRELNLARQKVQAQGLLEGRDLAPELQALEAEAARLKARFYPAGGMTAPAFGETLSAEIRRGGLVLKNLVIQKELPKQAVLALDLTGRPQEFLQFFARLEERLPQAGTLAFQWKKLDDGRWTLHWEVGYETL